MPRKIYWSPHGGLVGRWPVEQLVAAVAEAGYAGIEAQISPHWMNWRDPQDVAQVKALLSRHHLACPAVCWRGNQGELLFTNPRNNAPAKGYLVECIDVASQLGAGAVLLWPRIAEGVSRPAALAAAARVLNDVADLCHRRGVTLSVEFESGGHPLCGTPEETLELIDRTGEHVTICCDTIHLFNRGLDPYASVLPQRGKIGLVHLSDAERQVPGDGPFDFAAFVRALQGIAYTGPLFVQIDPRTEDDITRACRRAVEITAPLAAEPASRRA